MHQEKWDLHKLKVLQAFKRDAQTDSGDVSIQLSSCDNDFDEIDHSQGLDFLTHRYR